MPYRRQIRRIKMGIVNDLRKWLLIPGTVTTYTSPTSFTSLDFAGMINDSLIGYWVVVLSKYNGGAFGTGAPKYEGRMITGYTTAGVITHNAFSVILALGDEVLIVSPIIYEIMTIKGGGYSIQDVMDELAAELDIARGTATVTAVVGGVDVYNSNDTSQFILQELRADLNNLAAGDEVVFKIYTTEGAVERKVSSDAALTFNGVQDPARVEIIGSANQVWGQEGIRVTVTTTAGVDRSIAAYWRDAKRGS
jgi:hypothetical protein